MPYALDQLNQMKYYHKHMNIFDWLPAVNNAIKCLSKHTKFRLHKSQCVMLTSTVKEILIFDHPHIM